MKKTMFGLIGFLLITLPVFAADKTVYVYNWSEYLPDAVLSQFKKETGIRVVYTTYDNNEAMFAKVKLMKSGGYDVVVPSTYYVDRMRKEKLIQPVDKNRLPNFKNLDPTLLDKPYDPGNVYSVPYMWGSTAIGVNTEFVQADTIKSWKDLWRPEFKGRVLLNDDIREVFQLGFKVLGYSANDTDPEHVRQAFERLQGLLPNIRLFTADSPKQPFLNKEVYIGMIWSGEAYMAAEENPSIRYIYPEEGTMLWMDNMVIPAAAPNPDNAHAFINFILKPEIGKMISEEVGYATPNLASLGLMKKEVRENPTVYPPRDIVMKGEFQLDIGDSIVLYEKYWEMLKAGK